MTAPAPVAVRMTGISKSFGGIRALDSVDFEVFAGEVHALLGGNGAGKSTILKVLNGVHVPEEGTIEVAGQTLTARTPEAARAAGIAMNFQEMSLIPTLTVAQNIFLTREARDARGMIDDADSVRRAKVIFDMLQVEVDPTALVGDLGAGQKQLTEIAKAISQEARVLILDEPSTALSVSDVERLFVFLRQLKAKGVAIIYVSHRMDEIARIADRATILRDGKHVITAPLADLPIDVMIEHIVGKKSKGLADVARGDVSRGEVLLELANVTGPHKPENVSFARIGVRCWDSPACSALAGPPWRVSLQASNPPFQARSASRARGWRSAVLPTLWPTASLWCPRRARRRASSLPTVLPTTW